MRELGSLQRESVTRPQGCHVGYSTSFVQGLTRLSERICNLKALMYYGKEDLRLEDVPEPELKPGTIKIHPAFTGICGSNVHLYYDGAVNGAGIRPTIPIR